MSLRRSFLSRRINSRSSAFSKSFQEFKSLEISQSQRLGSSEIDNSIRTSNRGTDDGNAVDSSDGGNGDSDGGSWSSLLPELLGEIIKRVEESDDRWPLRQSVVACGCVCKSWRETTREIVKPPVRGGKITFPSCLKKPGPRDAPLQCLIKRNKKNSSFYLYLASCPSFTDTGKFLLAARRYRNGSHTEYVITLDADDLSQGSNAYVGKLSSDFLGTNFTIFDSQPPYNGAKPSKSRAGRRFASKQISPQVPASNFEVGEVSYKFNFLKSRGPRRMVCSLKCPSSGEQATHNISQNNSNIEKLGYNNTCDQTVLKNKAPRWHENLQCWCLNFHGRVTVASVKNFQLVATIDQSQPGGKGDEETVLLQFGKVGEDWFTMDYRQPLSAFQAFAICLTSFGTKLACE